MRAFVVLSAVVALAAACSAVGSNRGFAEGCESDTQCSSPMTCRSAFVNGACVAQKSCTITCSTDADCQALDPKGKCFVGCNEKVCLKTP
jgi:hypothetical protein